MTLSTRIPRTEDTRRDDLLFDVVCIAKMSWLSLLLLAAIATMRSP